MKSRVHPKYKTKYHVRNWASYERALIQRGDLTVWLSPDAVAAWEPATGGRRGGQRKYSDIAIETALTVRLIFHLPLRQAEGFLTSVFGLMRLDLRVPDHTTLSRRGQHLDVALCHAPREKRLHLLIDSTGLSIVGEGEWAAAKHGGHGKRGWKKLHLAVDQTGVIVAQALTDATTDDALTGIIRLYPDFPKGINTMYPYILRGKLSVRPAQVGGIDVNTLLSKLSWLLRIPNVDRILPLDRGATVR